jgi:hypothetical protein
VTARVSPRERIRAEIDELIAGSDRGSLLEHFEEVARAADAAPHSRRATERGSSQLMGQAR